jgi:guanylate kinase
MNPSATGRLVILSGPSCVGKSPLDRALVRFYPDLRARLQRLVLFNSRDPRPGEQDGVDCYFRTRAQIEALRSQERFAVLDVRGDLQALDLMALDALLRRGDAFFKRMRPGWHTACVLPGSNTISRFPSLLVQNRRLV